MRFFWEKQRALEKLSAMSHRLYPWGVFSALLCLYALTMPEHGTLEDSGAFITVARFAGIAHPPGYPLYTMLGAAFSWLPLGTFAVRVQLLSAICGAGACVCIHQCCLSLSNSRPAALAAALVAGLSGLLWSQSLIAEVYAPHAFVFFLLLLLALKLEARFRRKTLFAFTLVFSLGLCHHWPLLVLAAPAFAPLLLAKSARRRLRHVTRLWLPLGGIFLVGLSPYLYLVLRSAFDPYIAAFGPVSPGDLPDYILRRQYARVDDAGSATWLDSVLLGGFFFRELAFQTGLVAAPAALAGAVLAALHERRRALFSLFWAFLSSSIVLLVFLRFDYDILHRDAYLSYQAVPFGVAAIFLHYAVVHGRRFGRFFPQTLAVAAVLTAFATNFRKNDMRTNTFAFDYARSLLESLPPGSPLFLYGDTDLGPVAYANLVAKVRPDVRIYSQFGHLFANRLFSAEKDRIEEAEGILRGFLKRERRLFVTIPAGPFARLKDHSLMDHGLYYELSLTDTKTPTPKLVPFARAFLDRHLEGAHKDRWFYHRERVFGDFCRVLLMAGKRHPAFQKNGECKRLLAKALLRKRDHARAAEFLRELIGDGLPRVKAETHEIYTDYLRAAIVVVNAHKGQGNEKLHLYQKLVDEVFPATEIYPVCSNKITRSLLEMRSQLPLDIRIDELRKSYSHCPDFAGRTGWQSP